MSTQKLAPVLITDEGVLSQCKATLNKWSNKLPFTVSRNLGDAVELVSATMYHAYSFSIDTEFATRKFDLQKGGTPVSRPVDVDSLDLWRIAGVKDEGNFDFAIKETCYKETCEHCGGEGRSTCDECGGGRKVTCKKCDGSGKTKCHTCWGKGETDCPKIAGNWKHGTGSDCPVCHGTSKVICKKCHGTGEVTCSKCGGRGEVTCDKCDGKGYITCAECEGRGWNSFTWHLIQSEKEDSLNVMFYDTGIAERREKGKCKKYATTTVFTQEEAAGQVDQSGIPADCSDFAPDLCAKWSETHSKFEGHDELRVRKQKVELTQYDALVRYEYKFKDKTYIIWIDLANKRVFEGEEGGLFAEWSAQVAKEGDKFAGKNPQMAIQRYAMACAISKDNKEPAKKLSKQLAIGSWLFRIATAGIGGWLWSIFFGTLGADPVIGWYVAAAVVVADLMFASKKLWMSFVAAAAVYGFIGYLFPELMPPDAAAKAGELKRLLPPEITTDVVLRDYIVCSLLLWVGGTLLFARDLALRIRGGVIVFPILGALVGAACAPTGYLDFAKDPVKFAWIYKLVACGICGLAILRTLSRSFVQNCGRNAQKFPNFLILIEAKTLNPNYWLIPIYALVFAGVGVVWYFFAGPGVSVEEKAKAAERFLQNERNQVRGKYYLELTANGGYGPSIARLAELKVFGQCGYAVSPEEGYAIAVKAANMDVAKGCWIQGYCLEFGKGIAQNLADANACYAKGAKLGDEKSTSAYKKTEQIAKVWNAAHSGDKAAEYELALHYVNGEGIAKDESVARSWMTKSADAGFVKAQMTICDWLIKGIGGEKDPELGVKYCEKAAQQNDPEAIAILGYYYFDGKVVKRDYKKAIDSFNRACKDGSESAPYMLGYCYREGLGVEKNATKGYEFFKLAYERGSYPGAYACGECYEYSKGVSVDYTSALACYGKAAEKKWEAPLLNKNESDAKKGVERIAIIGKSWKAANSGDAVAMDVVGQCFANGTGVAKDAAKAYDWFAKSADKDNVDGIVHMADALYGGIGVKLDKDAAGKAFERAAAKNHVHALFMLGKCHEAGNGVEKNLTSAYNCYTKAAKMKYAEANDAAKRIAEPAKYWDAAFKNKDAKAQYSLGLCYKRGGCGVEMNDVESFKLFRMAADQNYAVALFEVAKCYAAGVGVAKNDSEMKKAVMAADKLNHAQSTFFLGELYQVGRAVEQDLTAAHDCFVRAAKAGCEEGNSRAKLVATIAKYWAPAAKGNAEAQFNLGACYRDGKEIAKDAAKAKSWFEKAVAQGQHDAEFALALENETTAKDNADAIAKNVIPLLQKAVAANHPRAKTHLGKFLYRGHGIDEDYERSVKLWEEAMAVGDLEAKYCLADYYWTGRGMFNSGKDQDKALAMWEEASKAGSVESTLRLASIYYEKGSGIFGDKKEVEKSFVYYQRACETGSKTAMKAYGEILTKSDETKVKGEALLKKASEEAEPDPGLIWYSKISTIE